MTERIYDLDRVAAILRDKYKVEAFVGQTGGGVATLIAGPIDDEGRAKVLAGPGWFEGPGWTSPRGGSDELAIGPDDDGEAEPVWVVAEWGEDEIAAEVARQMR